jgi:hypothetical protein
MRIDEGTLLRLPPILYSHQQHARSAKHRARESADTCALVYGLTASFWLVLDRHLGVMPHVVMAACSVTPGARQRTTRAVDRCAPARGVSDAESADLYALPKGVVQQIERTRT